MLKRIVNPITNTAVENPDHLVGSIYEREYFRVIPVATAANNYQPEKLFFENHDQYLNFVEEQAKGSVRFSSKPAKM